jgi:hypothetical protein
VHQQPRRERHACIAYRARCNETRANQSCTAEVARRPLWQTQPHGLRLSRAIQARSTNRKVRGAQEKRDGRLNCTRPQASQDQD